MQVLVLINLYELKELHGCVNERILCGLIVLLRKVLFL